MSLQTTVDRLDDRRELLNSFDRFKRVSDQTGLMEGLDAFEQQAFNLVLGKAPEAFDLKKEDPKTVAQYGKGLGEQMLIARRLCEAGCGFVTLSYGGESMIVGPRGEIFASLADETDAESGAPLEGFAVARIDLDEVRKNREEFQFIQTRQPAVYRSIVKKY